MTYCFSEETLTILKPEVLHAPNIIKPVQAKMVPTGEAVTLEAEFEGVPKPEVQWFHNGKEIIPSEKVNIVMQEHKTTLHIPQVFRPHGGKYEVRAINPAGEARSSGTISVTSKSSLMFNHPRRQLSSHLLPCEPEISPCFLFIFSWP